ncbi:TlpA family protein disulfide reductase [Nonomuraea purpurea]|uniref:TlpA family protein disulfide reductase n=1 Tax=Nonomuraea purpurea TaxID=1849276 RepID=A0ABV8GCN9_9ACTN
MTLLTTAVVLLAVVGAVHLLFTFGLVARIRELSELQQHGGGGHAHNTHVPRPGTVVRPFSVTGTDGAAITEADLDGPVQVGFFQVGCGPCRMLSDALVTAPPAARFVSIVHGDQDAPDATARQVAKLGALGRVAVIGVDDPVLTAFEVVAFPTLLHTHSGVVTASGTRLDDFADVTGAPTQVA